MATVAGTMAAPTAEGVVWSWLTTVDHKRIGVLYGVTAFIFFLIGGVEALHVRAQLATPIGGVVEPELYGQLFSLPAGPMDV
ncbi:MAG: cytochrome ubiquinol oxidase subunit I, partial [Chloroflexi bacterium]|nr:cytochrome ubiquinol oxidase subunit I [Chloroflexota bacterium]